MVLPEFCNHLSWYQDKAHCWSVSVELEGDWLGALSAKAREHSLYLVVNATVRRGPDTVTGTSLLYDPNGVLLAESDKQVLMGHENDFLQPAHKGEWLFSNINFRHTTRRMGFASGLLIGPNGPVMRCNGIAKLPKSNDKRFAKAKGAAAFKHSQSNS